MNLIAHIMWTILRAWLFSETTQPRAKSALLDRA